MSKLRLARELHEDQGRLRPARTLTEDVGIETVVLLELEVEFELC